LFSSCAYLHWDPAPLLVLVNVEEDARVGLVRDLAPLAVGLADLEPPVLNLDQVQRSLLGSLPDFEVTPPGGRGAPAL
jgi:hypothetical protein